MSNITITNKILEKKIKQEGSITVNNINYVDKNWLKKDYNTPHCQKRFNTFKEYCAYYGVIPVTSKKLIDIKRKNIVINETGYYKTRNSRIVRIFEIEDKPATFSCSGYLQKRNKKGELKDKDWNIWNIYGKFTGGKEHYLDILGKVIIQKEQDVII